MILHFFVKEGFAFKKRYAPRSNHHHWTEAGAHILRLSEPGKASSSREESSMSAGHRERARKISNLTTRGRKGTSRSQPHVDNSDLQNVCLSVGSTLVTTHFGGSLAEWDDTKPLSRTATRRPDIRPVSPPPTGADLRSRRGFYKSAPPRTLPVVPTAPWPHVLWSICGAMLGMSPKRMPIAKPQMHVR
jgi:hypothetical protein